MTLKLTPELAAATLPGWGSAAGLVALDPACRAAPEAAMDRMLVAERIARYCWAYDERRADLLADCFAADAVWRGDVLGRVPIGPFAGRDAIVRWLTEFWPHQHDQRRHMLLNTIVAAQDADRATTLSYLLLMASQGRSPTIETTGFYRVGYVREGETWRIAELVAGFDAPFWPGDIDAMSPRGRSRHGVAAD